MSNRDLKEVPVYLFCGFLDGGKTKFIQETLEDRRFNAGEKTLLLVCEEGEEEYETAFKAQKLFLYIQFTAICVEMIARGIEFPTSQEEISDFTRKVLKESSTLANRFICASGMKKTRLI